METRQDAPTEGALPTGRILSYEYNTLMTSLQVSVSKHLVDACYTLLWANDFYYKIIRYPKEEYEEKFRNRPDIYYSYHDYMDELGKVSEVVTKALTEKRPGYSLVTRLPVKGGGHIWVKMTGNFTQEYIDGYPVSYTTITNIDDLVQMQKDRSITYNSIPGFVARVLIKNDFSVNFLDANNRFKAFFDTGELLQIPRDIFRLNLNINREALTPQIGNLIVGKPLRVFCQLQNQRGQIVWMQIYGECVDWLGGAPVYLIICIDVTDLTDLREMQKKLKQQAQQLRSALQAAEDANRAKSDFLSRMSHDIRTPMNAIAGMTEIAAAHLHAPDKVQDCLKKISLSSQHLLGLINDVLDMSKIESGQMTLREDTMFLPEVMENIVAILQPMLKAKRQKFSVRLHHLLHEYYICDSLRLRQCFINILSNATKFTPEGGNITVDVEEAMSECFGEATLTFSFADTGIGIKPEFIDHIFDAFAREKDGRVDKTEGSGLGMAIAKKIVDLMSGSIYVESEVGRGTTFVVRLPLCIDDAKSSDIALPPLKVLVVDDDDIMCAYTSETLADCGVQVQWSDNGADAVRLVLDAHCAGEDFDAVILDWKMPGKDGIETAKEIRSELKAKIPILIASAYDWAEIEKEAKEAGANGFLPKPLFRSTLCRGLCKYVLGRKDATPLRSSERHYDFGGKRILLAEDNELNSEIVMELLSPTGALIEMTCDGAACVDRFAHSPEGYFDLILMDVQMPVMDGHAATRAIRVLQRKDAVSVPILAMTADAFAEDIAAAKEAGMNGHLSKPLNVAAMKYEIAKYLGY